MKSCVELLRSCRINILVVLSDIPEFCLDYKLPITKNIRTCTTCTSKFYQGRYRAKRKRGKSKVIRRDVESKEQRIGNWDRFIAVEKNEARLAHFLSTEMSQRYGTQVLDVSWRLAEGSERY